MHLPLAPLIAGTTIALGYIAGARFERFILSVLAEDAQHPAALPGADRAGGPSNGQPARKGERDAAGVGIDNIAKVGPGALFHRTGDSL